MVAKINHVGSLFNKDCTVSFSLQHYHIMLPNNKKGFKFIILKINTSNNAHYMHAKGFPILEEPNYAVLSYLESLIELDYMLRIIICFHLKKKTVYNLVLSWFANVGEN